MRANTLSLFVIRNLLRSQIIEGESQSHLVYRPVLKILLVVVTVVSPPLARQRGLKHIGHRSCRTTAGYKQSSDVPR